MVTNVSLLIHQYKLIIRYILIQFCLFLNQLNVLNAYLRLLAYIDELEAILADEEVLLQLVRDELTEIKERYGYNCYDLM
jgi:DNA gyrase/topoisomerase IV subunit A